MIRVRRVGICRRPRGRPHGPDRLRAPRIPRKDVFPSSATQVGGLSPKLDAHSFFECLVDSERDAKLFGCHHRGYPVTKERRSRTEGIPRQPGGERDDPTFRISRWPGSGSIRVGTPTTWCPTHGNRSVTSPPIPTRSDPSTNT